jgi:multicomponent Na+:H+ antiporter subunit B
MKRKAVRVIFELLLVSAAVYLLSEGVFADIPPETGARDYFLARGEKETGAVNLVSAIYLRYRNFDTLGETIVLLLSISGVVLLLDAKGGE